MLQKYLLRSGSLLIISVFCLAFGLAASANEFSLTEQDPEKIVFHIDGFTVQERDALVRAFQEDQNFQVEYSCVPAGVLVVSNTDPSREDLNTSISNILGEGVQNRLIELTGKNQSYAEEQCSNARNSR